MPVSTDQGAAKPAVVGHKPKFCEVIRAVAAQDGARRLESAAAIESVVASPMSTAPQSGNVARKTMPVIGELRAHTSPNLPASQLPRATQTY